MSTRLLTALVAALALLSPAFLASAAPLRLGTPFSDHMVLQRDKPVPVWGWAAPGDEVTVEFAGQRRSGTAGADGRWMARLEPLSANAAPTTLTVSSGRGGGPLTVADVLVGEVWLGSGQSNMVMQVSRAADFQREQTAANLPLVRMFREESDGAAEPQASGAGSWAVCSPDTVGSFSATLFFFGREIHRALGVPVGLVNSSVGGTPIDAWIDADAQRRSPELARAVAALDAEDAAFDPGARRNSRRMGYLYNAKIAPLIPYAVRGILWYQGEGNAKLGKAEHYRHQLPLLVGDWRAKWGEELPFAWVQLPNFNRGGDGWPVVREAMLETLRQPRTGMAITIDIGEPKEIHPRNKQDVGRRLAAWALADVYGKPVPARSGPLPAGSEARAGEVVCRFTEAEGLHDRDGGELDGFEIADADDVWHPARARIDGTTAVVSAAGIAAPAAVRYGWASNPKCDLANAGGLPASPFRAQVRAVARKPNVILFLVDDMGWMDSSPYGSRYYDTPAIARLAGQGMRFTRAYSQPLCSPTRASLLTGKNAARHGITSACGHRPPQEGSLPESGPPSQPVLYPESKSFLDPSEYTLAEALRDAGYRTGHFGKWHLGLTKPFWPEAQGFDVAFHCHPDPGPPGNYFSPYGVTRPGKEPAPGKKRVVGTITDGPAGEYITDRLTDEAIRFIETHVDEHRDKPFFLNLWHYGVHGPWGHKESLTAEMAERTDPTGRQGNPVMASMLKSIDESLGRLLDALDRLGIADETIVVFTSDNGGNTHSLRNGGGQRKPQDAGDPTVASYRKWAGHKPPTNNAPLRDGKGTLYEGGVRVPLIVRFPGRVKPGTTSDALVGCTDVYPTVLELAGIAADPSQVKDGVSYAGVLRGTKTDGRDSYVIWFPGQLRGAVAYRGTWKMISRAEPPRAGEGAIRELYNLEDDIGETKNLAEQHPEQVKELERVIDRLVADAGALVPRPNPAYRKQPVNRVDAAER